MLTALIAIRPTDPVLPERLQRNGSLATAGQTAAQHPRHAGVPAPRTRMTRSTEMQLLHEALARAEHSRRLEQAAAARTRRRLLSEARSRRNLEIAVRRLERASRDADRARARSQAYA